VHPLRSLSWSGMDAFTVVMVWVIAVTSGAWAALGVAQAASGRLFRMLNPRRIDWTAREARLLGWTWAIQGVTWAVWDLFGGLSFAHAIPMFWVGSSWGAFISAPVSAITLGTLLFMALVEQRHEGGWPFNRDRLSHSK
jgi:hypothetical protein